MSITKHMMLVVTGVLLPSLFLSGCIPGNGAITDPSSDSPRNEWAWVSLRAGDLVVYAPPDLVAGSVTSGIDTYEIMYAGDGYWFSVAQGMVDPNPCHITFSGCPREDASFSEEPVQVDSATQLTLATWEAHSGTWIAQLWQPEGVYGYEAIGGFASAGEPFERLTTTLRSLRRWVGPDPLPPALPFPPALLMPAHNTIDLSRTLTLIWSADLASETYRVQVSRSESFDDLVLSESGLSATSKVVRSLRANTRYYWRVAGDNSIRSGSWSQVRAFTTGTGQDPAVQAIQSGTTAHLHSVAWNGSLFVATGTGGTVLTSPDGMSWTERENPATGQLRSIVWTGERFVVVGSGTLVSEDGLTWTHHTSASGLSVASNGSLLVSVAGSTIYTSGNGETWSQWSLGHSRALTAVIWSAPHFIGVGSGGSVFTSPNGLGWTARTTNYFPALHAVAAGDSLLVAVGGDGYGMSAGGFRVSNDNGETWSGWRGAGNGQPVLRGIAWGDGKFLAVGERGSILVSSNGMDWQSLYSGTSEQLNAAAHNGSLWVVVGNHGTILVAP